MHDICTRKLNAEKGPELLCEVMSAQMMNRPAPYAKKLSSMCQKYDVVMIAAEMVEQIKKTK